MGIVIGATILWQVWRMDPLGIVETLAQNSTNETSIGTDEEVDTADITKPLLELKSGPLSGSLVAPETQNGKYPNLEVPENLDVPKKLDVPEESPIPKDLETIPDGSGASESSVIEIVDAIKPFSNSSRVVNVLVPKSAKRIEIGMIGADSTKDSPTSRYPGYQGILKVNGSPVVVFNRKYKWKGDGKWHTLSIAMDGKDVNTRNNETKSGAHDITGLVVPGETCVINYSHGQRGRIGIRLIFYSESLPL